MTPRAAPKADRRRALELLAASRDGVTEALMLAHGFRVELLAGLCIAGLATATPERMVTRRTEGGDCSLEDHRRGAAGVGSIKMDKDYLVLKRASTSRRSGEWNDNDFDVLADGVVVGRIMETAAAPVGLPWMWTLAFGHHEDRTPTHGYETMREAAMAAFAKSW